MTNRKMPPSVSDFLEQVVWWASNQPDLHGVALVGSYARQASRDDSDVDLVLLADNPRKYLDNLAWTQRFGLLVQWQVEDYGKVTSLRAWYAHGLEVEFGWAGRDWIAQPLDPGTRRVIQDGIRILFERQACLTQAVHDLP